MKNEFEELSEYNKFLEDRHITKMKRIEKIKKLYMIRLKQIEDKNKKIIKEKNAVIERLNIKIRALEDQRRILKNELSNIPEDILKRYN